jgi:hypothetical protein
MPRGKNVVLSNGRQWATRDAALQHFRNLRDNYELETKIDDPDDHDDLCALLERFDSANSYGPSKIGCGISHFITRENYANGGKTVGFWVVRTDLSETDFSFVKAVSPSPANPDAEFLDACRESVYEMVAAAKDAHFAAFSDSNGRVPCEMTGELLTNFEARLDYAPTSFRDIVWGYRAAQGWEIAIPLGIVTAGADAQTITTFIDIEAMGLFRAFHSQNASLRIISKSLGQSRIVATRSNAIRQPVRLF